jgi:uncharacterized membrane protein YcaP (DUF421 family)
LEYRLRQRHVESALCLPQWSARQLTILSKVGCSRLGFGLLVLYQFILTWVATRSSVVQLLIKAKPTLLFYKGQFKQKALKNERVAEGEVMAAIRSQGVGDMSTVDAVVLETDGSFSVIKSLENASALGDVQGFECN